MVVCASIPIMVSVEAIRALKKGAIGIVPTDTLYGICGSAFSPQAVLRIYTVKGRDVAKPFIILISSVADLKKFSVTLTQEQKKFFNSVWPGSVSVILPCGLKKFAYLHRGTESLAFRLPKNKKLRTLLSATGPLVAPSANPAGAPPASTIAEAKKYFGTSVDFYLAGGRKAGKPSKVISLLSGAPKIIRD